MWWWECSGVINNVNVMSQPLLPGSWEGSVIVFLSSTSTPTLVSPSLPVMGGHGGCASLVFTVKLYISRTSRMMLSNWFRSTPAIREVHVWTLRYVFPVEGKNNGWVMEGDSQASALGYQHAGCLISCWIMYHFFSSLAASWLNVINIYDLSLMLWMG